MSYADRLKAAISEKGPSHELTKPTKAPSVSFVSASSDPSEPELRALLTRHLGTHADYPEALAMALASPAAHLQGLQASMPPDCSTTEHRALLANPDFLALVGVAA